MDEDDSADSRNEPPDFVEARRELDDGDDELSNFVDAKRELGAAIGVWEFATEGCEEL